MSEGYDGPCEAGCIVFHGGEKKHHKDCGHYPHSLTKLNADRIEALTAERDALAEQLKRAVEWAGKVQEYAISWDDKYLAERSNEIIAELKGYKDE